MKKVIHTSGKRKRAIARATLRAGNGQVKINDNILEFIEPTLYRLKIMEPLILSGTLAKQVNISVRVMGGGFASQAEAARLAIGRALAEYDPKLKQVFLDYDRQMLVADIRRKECSKPNCRGQARSKKQKSYR